MNVEYRLAKADACCRLCERIIYKGEDTAIFIEARTRRAGPVILCPDCVRSIMQLVLEG